ncbi:hypothetical protein M885DRAFT_556589 [Pelagophyceae sp. CCMP2097]|nr:hypothetical protein M885DRAFT_556589 [Pelagophyceae sp. CCMP2097]
MKAGRATSPASMVVDSDEPSSPYKAQPADDGGGDVGDFAFARRGACGGGACGCDDCDGDSVGRDACCVCYEALPLDAGARTYYACCSKIVCTDCADKCETIAKDDRCPMCREPLSTSNAQILARMLKRVRTGDAVAQRQLGSAYRDGDCGLRKSGKLAFQFFELSAHQGNAAAQGCLAYCYYTGFGARRDARKAAKYFLLAAKQGDFQSQSNLASMNYYGADGVDRNVAEAVRLWKLAAGQGDPKAQASLGRCYGSGFGVKRDLSEALEWYKLAAAAGVPEVVDDIVIIEKHLLDAATAERKGTGARRDHATRDHGTRGGSIARNTSRKL